MQACANTSINTMSANDPSYYEAAFWSSLIHHGNLDVVTLIRMRSVSHTGKRSVDDGNILAKRVTERLATHAAITIIQDKISLEMMQIPLNPHGSRRSIVTTGKSRFVELNELYVFNLDAWLKTGACPFSSMEIEITENIIKWLLRACSLHEHANANYGYPGAAGQALDLVMDRVHEKYPDLMPIIEAVKNLDNL